MNALANKAWVGRYLDALSGKDKSRELVAEYVDDEELQQHIAVFEKAFPRYELLAEDLVAEGDKVALRATFKGTHAGDFMGVAPTGKQVELPVMLFYRIADGKIVEHWMNADQTSLMQQLGGAVA